MQETTGASQFPLQLLILYMHDITAFLQLYLIFIGEVVDWIQELLS